MRKEGKYTLFETLSFLKHYPIDTINFLTNRESEYELNKKNVPNN